MKKLEPRKKDEREPLGSKNRESEIYELLNACFKKKSIDLADEETILRWACLTIETERLVYLFEKIKNERLRQR